MADVSKIKLPSGTTYNIKDTVSGYTKNTGTITKIQTTAGAHTAIDVSSGAATFNVPTKTSHLTNDSGFINGNTGGVFYGTCSTSGDAIAKIVQCSAFTSADLIAGAIILVHFENTNSGVVADLTMNVNNTGAKAIKYINNGTLTNISTAGHLKANTSYFFVYDGSNWVVMYNFNSTYTSMSSGEAKAGTATSARSITAARLKEAILTHAPVTSINGETGDVTISVPQINYTIDGPDVDDLVGNVVQNDVDNNVASGGYALAEGYATTASGYASHAEGNSTNAEGRMSHAEGYDTTASGNFSHAEGASATASNSEAHAEGSYTTASGYYSHAEGSSTIASGNTSHAEGSNTTANTHYTHAEGYGTIASGTASHAEGSNTTASGNASHTEGSGTTASGSFSHASGLHSIAQGYAQTVIGKNNIADVEGTGEIGSGKYALIIGNGTMSNSRSNALTVDWNGNVDIASGAKYKINGTALSAADVGAVPTTRTVNNKALSANISLDASDVGAVPTSRTVNNKALSSDISLDASDVGAVPTTRTVNGKALTADVADADYITEEGNKTSNNIVWTYRKTHSGNVEAWATVSWSSTSTAVWASPVRYKDLTISIPSGIFNAEPRITATSTSTQYWVGGITVSSATSATIRFATVATSNFAFQAYVYATGS